MKGAGNLMTEYYKLMMKHLHHDHKSLAFCRSLIMWQCDYLTELLQSS